MSCEGCSENCEERLLEGNGRVVNHRNRNESIRPFPGAPGLRTGQAQDGLAGFFDGAGGPDLRDGDLFPGSSPKGIASVAVKANSSSYTQVQ